MTKDSTQVLSALGGSVTATDSPKGKVINDDSPGGQRGHTSQCPAPGKTMGMGRTSYGWESPLEDTVETNKRSLFTPP